MGMGLTVEQVLELGEAMRKQVVASASLEERLAGIAPEERLTGLAPEERLTGLAPEELLTVMKQIETVLGRQASQPTSAEEAGLIGQRQTLMHVLRHKFGELPQPIRQRIETMTDPNQLNRWLDQALDTQSLDALDFDLRPGAAETTT